jgi:molecular chaperone GrpE
MSNETRPDTSDAPSDPESLPPTDPAAESTLPPAEHPDDIRRERDEYRDLLLRKTAEFDNYRKRTERERGQLAEAAAVDLLTAILPLVDDLERALAADTGDGAVEAYRVGVDLIHRQLVELLRKRGVTPIDTGGQPFDPHFHQAVAHEVSESHAEGAIIDELRRGYMISGRLLRPAMVRVAKS